MKHIETMTPEQSKHKFLCDELDIILYDTEKYPIDSSLRIAKIRKVLDELNALPPTPIGFIGNKKEK